MLVLQISKHMNIFDKLQKIAENQKTIVLVEDPIVNSFTVNGKRYELTYSTTQEMYKEICSLSECKQLTIIKKESQKSRVPNDFRKEVLNILTYFINSFKPNKHSSTDALNYAFVNKFKNRINDINTILCAQIADSMLIDIWTSFIQNREEELYSTSYTGLISNIGISCIQWFLQDDLKNLEKKNFTIEYCNILSLDFKNKLDNLKKESFDFFFEKTKLYCIVFNFVPDNYKNEFLIKALGDNLNDITFSEYNPFLYKEYKKHYYKIASNLGAFLIEPLLTNNILIDFIHKKSVYIKIAKEYTYSLKYATSNIKPTLAFEIPISSGDISYNYKKHTLLLTSDTDTITNHNRQFSYPVISKELQDILKNNHTKFTILPFFELYSKYIAEIYSINFKICLQEYDKENKSSDSLDVAAFIYIHFNIKIFDIIEVLTPQDPFINDFLEFLNNSKEEYQDILTKKLSKELKEARDAFYNIKTKYNEQISKKSENIFSLESLLKDIHIPKDFLECENVLARTEFKVKLLGKVTAQKYFLNHFCELAEIYKHFDYFVGNQQKITGTGRLGPQQYFICLQTNKIARAFIGGVQKNALTKELFDSFKNDIKAILATEARGSIGTDYTTYSLENQQLKETYLLSFFSNINLESLLNLNMNDLRYVIRFLYEKKHIKKPDTFLIGLSILHYFQNNNLYDIKVPFITLDATSSGTQIIATIFRNKEAALKSSLIGSSKWDNPTEYLKDFENFLQKLRKQVLRYGKDHTYDIDNIYQYKQFYETISKTDFIEDKDSMLFTDFESKFIQSCFPEIEKSRFDLMVINLHFSLKILFNKEPILYTMLQNRQIIKKRIMAEAYGMTMRGGLDSIQNAVRDEAFLQGNFGLKTRYIYIFSDILSKYFQYVFRTENLNYMVSFMETKQFINLLEGPLKFKHNFLTWEYAPKITEKLNLQVKSRSNSNLLKTTTRPRRHIVLQLDTNELNKKKIKTGYEPLVIHSIESWITYDAIKLAQEVNKLLLNKYNITFAIATNYDCFATTIENGVILRFLLQRSYRNAYEARLHKSILNMFEGSSKELVLARQRISELRQKKHSSNYWDGNITNEFFVKV